MGYARSPHRHIISRQVGAFVPLTIGSQFPNLIDKPLAHSAFSLLLIGALLNSVTRIQPRGITSRLPTRLRASIPTAFLIGSDARPQPSPMWHA